VIATSGASLRKAAATRGSTGDHAGVARDHDRVRGGIFRNGRDRGHVAGAAKIFGQRARDDVVDLER
jgi:hypothetical protein